VGFTGRKADDAVRQVGFTEERTVWRAQIDAELRRYFRQLAQPVVSSSPLPPLRVTGLLYLMLDRIGSFLKPLYEVPNNRQSNAAQRAIRFIELHAWQGIGVADIALHMDMERTYFATFFKRMTGSTPTRFLQAYRMARAERLLAETDSSVKEIAASVGYTDYFVFEKRFKMMHASTPSEFRERNSFPAVKVIPFP
jgi:AraC-like DNA-binding protein